MARPTIVYICDGKACQDPMYCHSNGSDCKHTSKLEHALNYSSVPTEEELEERFKYMGHDVYFEKD